jgi:serine/threonine protein kinase
MIPSAPASNEEQPEIDVVRTKEFSPNAACDTSTTPASPVDAPVAVMPAAFGRYQVRRVLGSGGFGIVYLGYDAKLDRSVAIKALRNRSGKPGTEGERFLQEARRLAQLRHPGIVTVHDVGVQEGQLYLVSDYLDGPDLGCWMRENRPNWSESARIVAAVADALAHAHARRIVHRDIKPENILLTVERVPVLVDFGLALDETKAGGQARGIISGTPCYMSPEQVTGAAHRIDGRTDIFSLGVVFYEMLTGRLPFQATDTLELMRQVRDDEPQPPGNSFPTFRRRWNGLASRRWRRNSRIAIPPQQTSPRIFATLCRHEPRHWPPCRHSPGRRWTHYVLHHLLRPGRAP